MIQKVFIVLILPITVFMVWTCQAVPGQESRATQPGWVTPAVVTGAENLIANHLDDLTGLRVGLVMNPTARIGETHMLDTLMALDLRITALFAPEHGFRGEAGAGETIDDGVDQATGLPVYSLYGETRKPTAGMLADVDILLFDMQDVGARFYTYNATLSLVIEAAAENGIAVWVLDRPNPAGGNYLSGWVLEEEFRSFVGMHPMPVAHGMTLGELGRMVIGEGWMEFSSDPLYRVIPMSGWTRDMKWPDTGLEWHPPSPNLPTFEHAFVYLGTCLIEGTSLSEGRGTRDPFLLLGAPGTRFEDAELAHLQAELPGVNLERASFIPETLPGIAVNPKHEGDSCTGVRIRVQDYETMDPVEAGLRIMAFLTDHTPGVELNSFLYNLAGSRKVDQLLEDIDAAREFNLEHFEIIRRPYLLYE